jgi:metal-responsive CopG/Arc/MetJ family transcriptional regulator
VARVTIDLPDPLARRLRDAAQRAKKSLSAYVAELLKARVDRSRWPEGFFELAGKATIELDDDPPLGEPPLL